MDGTDARGGTGGPEIRPQDVRAEGGDGLRFRVSACGEGDRLALCLHGFPELGFSWRHQLPLLARLGWRAWAPDLRGYGASERPKGVGAYAIERLLDDVRGLVAASGARTTMLLGHDWGAIVAWYFAMRHPDAIERLVILNVPHPACMERELRRWPQRRRSWYALFFQLPWLPEWLLGLGDGRRLGEMFARTAVHPERFGPEVQRVYAEAAREPAARTAMLNYYRALLRGGARRQRALGYPVIEVPTLMIWGEQDVALTKETTFGTGDHVRDLTLRYLPDASHWVQQDAPDEVNAILEAWLEGREPPGNRS